MADSESGHPPDIQTIETVVKLYKWLERRKDMAGYLTEAARHDTIKCDKDTLLRRIERFEQHFGQDVCVRGAGRTKTRIVRAAAELIGKMERLVSHYESEVQNEQRNRQETISLGCSPALAEHFAATVINEYKQRGDGLPDVVVHSDFPQEIRRRGLNLGEFDVVITSFEASEPRNSKESIDFFVLPSALLLDRRNKRAQEGVEDWSILAEENTAIVLQDLSRDPEPSYGFDAIPSSMRVIRVKSYRDAVAMVLGGSNFCAIAHPQILNPYVRSKLYENNTLPGLGDTLAGIVRPGVARRQSTNVQNEAADLLADVAKEKLSELNQRVPRSFLLDYRYTYNVSHRNGKPCWLRGELRPFNVTPDHVIYGQHSVYHKEDSPPLSFEIIGRITHFASDDSFHIVWRGGELLPRDSRGHIIDRSPEDYLVSFFHFPGEYRQAKRESSELFGIWLGRRSWVTDASQPDQGYFVLSKNQGLEDDWLRQVIDAREGKTLSWLQSFHLDLPRM